MGPKTGEEYWNLMKKTAARVDKWPAWKTGAPTRTGGVMDRAEEIAGKVTGRPKGSLTRKAVADALREYAKEAVEAERERCAKIAADYPWIYRSDFDTRAAIAAQIREGKKA